jgi:ribosomal protein S18 acetylase RimI-like enzyme
MAGFLKGLKSDSTRSGLTPPCKPAPSRKLSQVANFPILEHICDLSGRYNSCVPFRIRTFTKADFETLWQIDQACFDPQLAYSRPELAFYMRRPKAFTLVAETPVAAAQAGVIHTGRNGDRTSGVQINGFAGTSILGFIVAETQQKTGHIITIDVIAEARRLGVGSALLQEAETLLKGASATVVELETPVNNEGAIRFYKKEGYFVEKTLAGYYSNQMDALVMTKELAA